MRRFGAIGVILLGISLLALPWSVSTASDQDQSWLMIASVAGGLFVLVGTALLRSTWPNNTSWALMRWDWYLPVVHKRVKTADASSMTQRRRPGLLNPRFDVVATQSARRLRSLLKRLGPSCVASPARRAVQAACLLLYLLLFFYVCWPYTAKPAAPGERSSGWKFAQLAQHTGTFQLLNTQPPDWAQQAESTVYLVDESADDIAAGCVGELRIVAGSAESITVLPDDKTAIETIDRLVTSPGPWTICQRNPIQWPAHYANDLCRKEFVAADLFLAIDPLVSFSTAIATRSWIWSLSSATVTLIICLFIPRGFCGYVCPLGTTIDLFDWSVGKRVRRWRAGPEGWSVHIKYYLLAGTLTCAVCGVLVSGFFAAIPIITRGLLFIGEPLQTGIFRGWHLVPSVHAGHILSVAMLLTVLALGLLRPRFWCRYACPTGAVFSLGSLLRTTERKVESTCIHCNQCVEICPFDAIKPDFTTRGSDCTFCQTCGGVCPTHAIKFTERWNNVSLKMENDPPTNQPSLGRRGFLSWLVGCTVAGTGGVAAAEAVRKSNSRASGGHEWHPIRPPGSVPERAFLQMCIRCGQCFKVCPNNVLQAEGFQQGLDGIWTPLVTPDWAGCESSCNACGQVCPTGAIRALPLREKRFARIGLAIVNRQTCLPFANRQACQLCVDECDAAGYRAIEFIGVHTQADEEGHPVDGTGFLAPVVSPEKCVGCGLCQTRCFGINVKQKQLIDKSAVLIQAGPGKEDRIVAGSYTQLHISRTRQDLKQHNQRPEDSNFFVPGQPLHNPDIEPSTPSVENPFG